MSRMSSSLRILLAVHHFPPNYLSGAEWQAYRIAKWLKKMGHEVRVICVESDTHGPGGQCECRDEVYDDIPVQRLYFNLPLSPDPFRWSFRNPVIGQHLDTLIADYRPNLLHLISGYLMTGVTVSVAQTLGIPTILMPMDFWFLCPRITLLQPNGEICRVPEDPLDCLLCLRQDRRRYRLVSRATGGLSNRILRHLWGNPSMLRAMKQKNQLEALRERREYLRRMFESADGVVSNSRFLKEMFVSRGFHPRRFFHLRQGLDTDSGGTDREKDPAAHLRIGYIGQIARHKGVALLVQAFQRLQTEGPMPKLLIYGDMEKFPRFARYLHHLVDKDERIEFAGTFKNDQIMQVHRGLDVLVVPSVWYENSPNVILEAFAAGTPVVASDIGGMAELVQHEVNGLLFSTGDVADLAHQLQRVLAQPVILKSLKQGIPPVKTVQAEMADLVRIYYSVMERD